jgi:hypothetical protein
LTAGIQTALGRPVVEAPPFDVDALEVALLSSEEFSIRSGSSAVGLVTGMYRTILGRDPEPSGLAAAVTSHSNGLSPDDLARNLQSSREAALTKAARWFQSILGRTQSLDALKGSPEVGPWASLVEGGSKDADIQAALLSSTEFRLRSGGNSDGFTRALYRYVLDRDPESSAFQEWRAVAGSTEARHASIRWLLGSDEAKRVVTARMYRSTLGRSASTSQLVNDPGVIGWSERLEV